MREHKTFVVDTSVVLADPQALFRFDEHAVVLPLAGRNQQTRANFVPLAALRG